MSTDPGSHVRRMTPVAARLARGALWLVFGLALTLTVLFATWRALAALDFGYPVLYELLGIERTIDEYGPENDVRPGFHRTSEAERERIFGEIVDAVRANGRGLQAITYRLPGGRTVPLLTGPEIQHLNDVAVLVTRFERLGWLAAAVTAGGWAAAWIRRWRQPPLRRFALGLVAAVGIGTVAVLALGPVAVFYWLHERVFPPDHPWFFWYEESLMSMLMQAPNLFGAIAVLWLPLAVIVACGAWSASGRILAARTQ